MRLAAFILLVSTGCEGDVEIRACNDTGATITGVKWHSYSEPLLAAGACSEYRVPEGDAYRYTVAEFVLSGQTYRHQPIDFVGETPLDGGRWSYHVTVPDLGRPYAAMTITRD